MIFFAFFPKAFNCIKMKKLDLTFIDLLLTDKIFYGISECYGGGRAGKSCPGIEKHMADGRMGLIQRRIYRCFIILS